MSADRVPFAPVSHHPVIVRPEPPGKFTAEPIGLPELRVIGETVAQAVEQARQALMHWPGGLCWVPVGRPSGPDRLAHAAAGHARDDPDFDLYLEEIRRYRQEVEERECPNSSSTPIT